MTNVEFLTVLQKIMFLILELAGPILLVCLLVGLAISIFQAVTQIQEATITFVPKILAALLAIVLLAPWMLELFTTNIYDLFNNMNSYIH